MVGDHTGILGAVVFAKKMQVETVRAKSVRATSVRVKSVRVNSVRAKNIPRQVKRVRATSLWTIAHTEKVELSANRPCTSIHTLRRRCCYQRRPRCPIAGNRMQKQRDAKQKRYLRVASTLKGSF